LVEKIRREELPPGQNMAQWALAWCLKNPAVAKPLPNWNQMPPPEIWRRNRRLDI
jgi:myo-inositol catabolism protein IolS